MVRISEHTRREADAIRAGCAEAKGYSDDWGKYTLCDAIRAGCAEAKCHRLFVQSKRLDAIRAGCAEAKN